MIHQDVHPFLQDCPQLIYAELDLPVTSQTKISRILEQTEYAGVDFQRTAELRESNENAQIYANAISVENDLFYSVKDDHN